MFLRFERVQRPQSFNDNPITSLSWMANDNGPVDGSGTGNGGHHHPGGSSASPSASPSGSGDNNNNNHHHHHHGDQNQPQPQQQPQDDNHHHHNHHHPLFDDDDEPSRDINNNDTTNDNHQHHHNHHHHHDHHNHNHPHHDHTHEQHQHHSHNHHNHQHLSPHPHGCESSIIVKQTSPSSSSSASSKDQEWPDILDGWLAVGNCRGVVGVSYTTIDSQQSDNFWDKSADPLIGGDTTSSILDATGNGTMMMDDDQHDEHDGHDQHYRDHFHDHDLHLHYHQHHIHHHQHQQQQQNRSITMPKSVPVRTNFNLRGHRSEIVFVRWNEPYQKLASCDRNGVIFVWIKYEGRWSIELINDRNTRVTDFAWSHDGRMALICYMDGFVLVGSVSGQRYWSSMLNLNECTITCGTWTPTNQSVLFGTSNGHILVISVHGVFITQISVQEGMEIIGMQWSCRKFMKTNEQSQQQPQQQRRGEQRQQQQQGDQSNGSPVDTDDTPTQHQHQQQHQYMLAVSFVDGTIYLMKNYDEVFPNVIETSLINVKMEWSNDGEILAIGGHRLIRSMNRNPVPGPYMYQNIVRFYRSNGQLIKQVILDFNWQPLSALTWACNDRRMFIACGQLLYVAWIIHGIPSLSFFSGLQVYNGLKKFDDIDRLLVPVPVKNLLGELFTPTIHCYLPDYNDIGRFVFRPPANHRRLHCTLMRHEDLTNSSVDAIYILYLEYLGSLVPILKGKRSSKIKPEFIIFDPRRNCTTNSHDNNGDQMACGHNHHNHHHHQHQHKSIHDNNLNMNERKFRCLMANNTNHNNIGWIHPPPPNVPIPPPPPPPPPQAPLPQSATASDSDNDDSEHSGIFMGQPPFLTPKTRRRLRLSSGSSRSHGSRGPRGRRRRSSEQQPQPPQQPPQLPFQQQDGDGGGEQSLPRMSRHYQHHHHLHYTPWLDELPEQERIVLVTSNIWGTKFKFLSLTPQLPGHIGSVTYKTSLLHLQPRQMSLVIKELNENNTLNHMPCPSGGHHHCCADQHHHHHHQHHLVDLDTLDNLDNNKNTNHDPNRSTGLYSYSSYCSSEESEDEEQQQQQQQLQLQLRQQQQQQMAEMLMMDMPDQMTSMPTIVPIGSLNAVRNSMLLSLTDLNADQQPQPQPPQPQDVHSDPHAMVGPSGGGQSKLQSQINQECTSSYTMEIKPSTSAVAPKTTTTTTTTTTANYNINNNGGVGGNNNDHNGESITPPISPGSPAPSLKTKRSQSSNSATMVRQFKHQTFHSESPKHVSAFYRQQQQPQQQQPTTSQSQPMSPKNGSPNRQGSRSSPRRNSTVSCCVQKFQKKTGYSIDTAAAAADGTPTNGAVDRQKMLFEIDLDGGAHPASTAMVAVGGGGGGGGLSHCATPTTYQTFHIYDDTDLRKSTKRLNQENNVLNNSDNDNDGDGGDGDDGDEDDQKKGVDRREPRPPELDETDMTENYLKNVEQVVQSLSEKLSQKMNASNNLIRKQDGFMQEYSNSSSVSNLSQQQQQCFSNGGGRKQHSMLGCDGLQTLNQSLLSIHSLANYNESENQIQQQQPLPNLPTTSGGGTRKHHHHNHHHHQQKNPISLPSSPLLNQDRRKLSMDYPSVSGSQMLGPSQPRKSNGRHFFQSPKLVRKLRRKWSYLDCSSEDDNSSDDDDDDDPGSLSLTDETDASISSINVRKRRMLNALNRKDEMRKLQQHAPCNTPVQHECLKNAKHHGHNKGKGPHHHRHHHEDDSLDDGKRFTLHNKAPLWNEVSQVYQLDFGGRVTQESAKNFQIEHQGKQVMQFGRIDTNAYTLDFEYPFSAIQAMAVALANVTQRLK